MNEIVKLDLCNKHQQEKSRSQFDPHNCDFCKLQREWEGVRAELLELQGLATCKTVEDQSKPVALSVPQPFETDAELNLMSMLNFIMNETRDIRTDDAHRRVVEWFYSRYREK